MAGPRLTIKPGSGRKSPAALAAADRRPAREIMWAKMRELRIFTVEDVAAPARLDKTSAQYFLNGLLAAGIVTAEKAGRAQPTRYELVKDPGALVPRIGPDGQAVTQGDIRAGAWRAMRVLGNFTLRDLHVTSGISEVDAKSFCKYLVKAGYIVFRAKGAGGRPSVYRFVEGRYTGPRPPQVARIMVVFDPNIGEVVWPLADQADVGAA
ncbi:MAG: hypothetical protein PHS60_15960 [Zavarzinia sp.]|nr:hypothetical protein [Zavarzinia sp.]